MVLYTFTFFNVLFWVMLTIPFVHSIATRYNMLDVPDTRKIHTKLTPRLGGVALYAAIFLTVTVPLVPQVQKWLLKSFLEKPWLITGATGMCAIGVVDDIWGLSARKKLFLQVFVAILVSMGGFHMGFLGTAFLASPLGTLVDVTATVLWIIMITNAMNLIDGLDGLAAGIAMAAALPLMGISHINGYFTNALLTGLLAGSIAGFLSYNVFPAKIFLGDSGSYLLGFFLATLSIQGTEGKGPFVAPAIVFLLLYVPLLDTQLAFLRRSLKGYPLFVADGSHIHHRLVRQGIGQRQTVFILWAKAFVFGLLGWILNVLTTPFAVSFTVCIAILLIGLSVKKLGFVEIQSFAQAFVHPNRRLKTPRDKNLCVVNFIKHLGEAEDIDTFNQRFIGLALDIDLDFIQIEIFPKGVGEQSLTLVEWKRDGTHPDTIPNSNRDDTYSTLHTVTESFHGKSGIDGSIVLGRQAAKLRRKSEESQQWVYLLAQGMCNVDFAAIRQKGV